MARRPEYLYEQMVDEGLGQELLRYLFSNEPDHETARTLHTRLRKALDIAAGAPLWSEPAPPIPESPAG